MSDAALLEDDVPTGTGPVDDRPDVSHETATSTWRKLVRYGGRPLVIALVLGGHYLDVTGIEWDSVEQRTYTWDFITPRLTRHLYLTFVSTAIVLVIAIPLGIAATRPALKRVQSLILGLGNLGQAIPSLGLITLLVLYIGTGVRPVIIALVAYSALPIIRNTMVGLQQVDRNLLEAARGMGMSPRRVLRTIEMPLAVPVILAGVRTALVINVGTATLAYLYGAGGLGEIIFRGFQLNRDSVLYTGALLTAALALLIDYLASLVEEWLTPRGL